MQEKKIFGFWGQALSEAKQLRSLVGTSMLLALGVVLRVFSIPFGHLFRISFSFLTNGLAGYLYGPFLAGGGAALLDILGYLVKMDGPFFPGFTFSALVGGFVYGCWLYRAPVRLWRAAGACATNTLLVSFLLNPLWLKILYGNSFWMIVAERWVGSLLVLPINTAMLYATLLLAEKNRQYLVRS